MSETNKTEELKVVIKTKLDTLTSCGATYYRKAPVTATYPYKVFDFRNVAFIDSALDRYTLTVDIWDKSQNPKRAEEIADKTEKVFNQLNLPSTNILPTFWREGRMVVMDEDKDLQHILLQFQIQNYERN